MGKTKKSKKKLYAPNEYETASGQLKKQWKSFNKRLALLMLLIFCVLCFVYYLLLSFHLFWVTPAFYGFAAVLFLVFFFVNRGFSREPVTEDILPESWSPQKKQKFIEDDIERKAFARKLMILLVPVLLLVGIDIILVLAVPMLFQSSH